MLTVPVSRLVMRIPKAGLSKGKNPSGGSANSPRYFYLENQALHLIISGWFEPERGFKGVEDFWAAETANWKRLNRPEAQNVSFEKLGSWNAILYDIPITGAKNSHVRAHWVQSGDLDRRSPVTHGRPFSRRSSAKAARPSTSFH